jgi:aspartate aminotransferase
MSAAVSRRTSDLSARYAPLIRFFTQSTFARRGEAPEANLFVVGDPQEMALPRFVDTVRRHLEPRHPHWFAYQMSQRPAQEAAAAALSARLGIPFEADDVSLTNGAFTGLAAALAAVTDPGDEVVYLSPPWFWYEGLLLMAGVIPVRVPADPASLGLDLAAIEAALTPRTRAIIVNTPNNPAGLIYSPEALRALAERLAAAGERHGRPIYIISDEAYSRILFDGRRHHSPAEHYPYTLVVYTYGKTLLTPGERLGFVALPAAMPGREAVRSALLMAQIMIGYGFPNATLQRALPELESLSIDLDRLQRRRDRFTGALRGMGYEVNTPEATFYLLARSPLADDAAFVEHLAQRDVFVLPGSLVELPGYFRISLTGNDAMVERSLPAFEAAREAAPA